MVMGALHPGAGQISGTLILLGAGRGFWPALVACAEYRDAAPDPVDRYSRRTIEALATAVGPARAIFPFGGPPYAPFIDWALKSGRAFTSPVGMLVHDTVGMMISYRGALLFEQASAVPEPVGQSPCKTCAGQPCKTSCPVSALSSAQAYDVAACHGFLDTEPGQPCMEQGCAVRRACPVSQGAGRVSAQSAHHMKAFHRQ